MKSSFRFSNHAEERLVSRGLSKQIVIEVLDNPDRIIRLDSSLSIHQKIFVESSKRVLYRVFVNHDLDPNLIVTVYKTSKLEKYENQV